MLQKKPLPLWLSGTGGKPKHMQQSNIILMNQPYF